MEAFRVEVSRAAIKGNEHYGIMTNDVARAFFEAPIHREVCIELPMETQGNNAHPVELVGMLRMSLDGRFKHGDI